LRGGGIEIWEKPLREEIPAGAFCGWLRIVDWFLIKNGGFGGADGSASDLRCGNGPLWRGVVGYRRASFP
jgi:hypothetical protein